MGVSIGVVEKFLRYRRVSFWQEQIFWGKIPLETLRNKGISQCQN